jgi:hypothetical protein
MIHIEQHKISVGSWSDYQDAIVQEPRPFQAIVNVSELAPMFGTSGVSLYWYPINELSQWGYGPFYWAKRVLDFHAGRGDSVLTHCKAGAHRSPIIVFTWLLSIGVDANTINEWMGDDYADLYRSDVRRGTIPGDLDRLYELMRDPQTGLTDCLEEMKRHRAH